MCWGVAEYERALISTRTKAALEAAKARGKVLGNSSNLKPEAAEAGRKLGAEAIRRKADDFARDVLPIINQFKGQSLRRITRELNERRILTARGKAGVWTPTAVKNVLAREGRLA